MRANPQEDHDEGIKRYGTHEAAGDKGEECSQEVMDKFLKIQNGSDIRGVALDGMPACMHATVQLCCQVAHLLRSLGASLHWSTAATADSSDLAVQPKVHPGGRPAPTTGTPGWMP